MRPSRDDVYMGLARVISARATCSRRKVGCVLVSEDGIVLSLGYNGVPSGRPHCNEGFKCEGASAPSGTALDACEAIHAEANALIRCPDIRLIHTAYVTTSPCIQCTKLLLNTGCRRIVFDHPYPHPAAEELWTRDGGREWLMHGRSLMG